MTTNNPYEAPKSAVEVIAETTNSDQAPFFTTSTLKLILMSMGTLGIYDLYWFYKNWVLIKQRTGEKIMPFWRAFFAIFWVYSCFKHIKNYAISRSISNSLPIVALAIAYIIVQLIGQAPESPADILAFFGFLALIPANNLAIKINKEHNPNFINNEKFSALNWVVVIVGGLFFGLLIFASINPELFAEIIEPLLQQ